MQKANIGKWVQRSGLLALMMTSVIATGCGGGGGGGGTTANAGSSDTAGNSAPTIIGSLATQASIGSAYTAAPQASDADGDTLAFSIQNKPAWAQFNTTTGQLSGTPDAQNTTAGIVITVSDGTASASLPAFSINVGAKGSTPAQAAAPSGPGVALAWDVPTRTVTGETLENLAGYRIHFGTNENALVNSIEVLSAGQNSFTVQDLPTGTYYFAVRAFTESGDESKLSNVIARKVG
jgi:hypothetical protein